MPNWATAENENGQQDTRALRRIRPLAERFWAKVQKGAGCWIWIGRRTPHGYGQIGAGRRDEGLLYTHRVSWEIHHGAIPDGLQILHRCDNPPCVNPDHLFLGDALANSKDKFAKGRANMPIGTRVGSARLTEDAVRQIRLLWRAGGVTKKQLAKRFGVAPPTIRLAVTGQTWRHITDEV